jgi:hypothetical protein
MSDAHAEAKKALSNALCAVLFVRPLDAGLDEEELKRAALQGGAGAGALEEVFYEVWTKQAKDAKRRAIASMFDCDVLAEGHAAPTDLIPVDALQALERGFDQLDRDHGKNAPKSLALITAACPGVPSDKLELALGLMVPMKRFTRSDAGFARTGLPPLRYQRAPFREPHPQLANVRRLIPIVSAIIGARTGTAVPETSPMDRFALWLKSRGWAEFARWWALTSTELTRLSDAHHPTAVCVLCGALLEGALVAVSTPARDAGEWTQKFLNNEPTGWKLHDLIAQAEAAKTFTKDEAQHARRVAEFRNRIHAGKFSTAGKPPFVPPHTNVHEAQASRIDLAQLLDALLKWPPVASLTSGAGP